MILRKSSEGEFEEEIQGQPEWVPGKMHREKHSLAFFHRSLTNKTSPFQNNKVFSEHVGDRRVRVYLPLVRVTSGAVSPCRNVCSTANGKESVDLTW